MKHSTLTLDNIEAYIDVANVDFPQQTTIEFVSELMTGEEVSLMCELPLQTLCEDGSMHGSVMFTLNKQQAKYLKNYLEIFIEEVI